MSAVQFLSSTADKVETFRTMLLMRCGTSAALVCLILCLLDALK